MTQAIGERWMQCPACSSPLKRAPVEHELYGCTGCGGIWAAKATAERVVSAIDERIVQLAELAARNFAELPMPPESEYRPCAECGAVMTQRTMASTRLDVCPRHGTFFDRGELQYVARVLESERRGAKAAPSVSASTAVDGVATEVATHVALGAAEVALQVIGELLFSW